MFILSHAVYYASADAADTLIFRVLLLLHTLMPLRHAD